MDRDAVAATLEQAGLDGYPIPREVMERADLNYGARCLYGVLRRAEVMGIHLTNEELAEATASNGHSVYRWIIQLRDAGLIDRPAGRWQKD